MLASFVLRSTFYKMKATLRVDLEDKAADLLVTYEGRIVLMEDVRIFEVDSLDKAERWLRRDMGERGSFVEWLHWMCQTGRLQARHAEILAASRVVS